LPLPPPLPPLAITTTFATTNVPSFYCHCHRH
jgi:hypothetical protein